MKKEKVAPSLMHESSFPKHNFIFSVLLLAHSINLIYNTCFCYKSRFHEPI